MDHHTTNRPREQRLMDEILRRQWDTGATHQWWASDHTGGKLYRKWSGVRGSSESMKEEISNSNGKEKKQHRHFDGCIIPQKTSLAVLCHLQRCQRFSWDGSLSPKSHSGIACTEEMLQIAGSPNFRFKGFVGSAVTRSVTARMSSVLHNLTLR